MVRRFTYQNRRVEAETIVSIEELNRQTFHTNESIILFLVLEETLFSQCITIPVQLKGDTRNQLCLHYTAGAESFVTQSPA